MKDLRDLADLTIHDVHAFGDESTCESTPLRASKGEVTCDFYEQTGFKTRGLSASSGCGRPTR
jgi:hypothetical protein